MAKIIIDIPDAKLARVLDGICGNFRYQAKLAGPPDEEGNSTEIDNPETKAQFAKRMVIEGIKSAVRSWEANQATDIARKAAIENANKLNIT